MSRTIAENIQVVRQRIDAAAKRAGRKAAEVRLIAVTKNVALSKILEAIRTGCFDLGESRPQEIWKKSRELAEASPELASQVRWHMIGHLQSNKVEQTLPFLSWLHSGDRWSLLETVNEAAIKRQRTIPTLLEVNISGEPSKHGFSPHEIEPLLEKFNDMPGIEICGLMGMSGLNSTDDERRHEFAQLRELRDRLNQLNRLRHPLNELSMGMSDDFEMAIEEGATMVRVGSALFEEVND